MDKFHVGKVSRRRWLGFLGSGLVFGALSPNLRAMPVKSNVCWDGLAPAGSYSLKALKHINAHLPFHFEIQQQFDHPVLSGTRPQLPGYGFEGGVALKVGGLYRLFTCQFKLGDYGAPTTLPYWVSRDGKHWKFKSSVVGTVPPAESGRGFVPWEPTPIFDHDENRWYLFFVAYNNRNQNGKIRMMTSSTRGYDHGIDGPWHDLGVVMQPDAESQPWEGPAGVDSFFPYQANGRWYALYGSSNWGKPKSNIFGEDTIRWLIGLASAPALKGPWKRHSRGNPLPTEKVYWENPIVSRIGRWYVAVYDAVAPGAPTYIPNGGHITGYTCSRDGIHWLPGGRILVQPDGPGNWSRDLRTPMGLIPEGKGVYTLFYTGFERAAPQWTGNESIGMVRLRIVWHR